MLHGIGRFVLSGGWVGVLPTVLLLASLPQPASTQPVPFQPAWFPTTPGELAGEGAGLPRPIPSMGPPALHGRFTFPGEAGLRHGVRAVPFAEGIGLERQVGVPRRREPDNGWVVASNWAVFGAVVMVVSASRYGWPYSKAIVAGAAWGAAVGAGSCLLAGCEWGRPSRTRRLPPEPRVDLEMGTGVGRFGGMP